MKKNTARKLSENDSDFNGNSDRAAQLFVRKDEKLYEARESTYMTTRFRGDLLIYFVAAGIWMVGTIWLVVRLIDKFF